MKHSKIFLALLALVLAFTVAAGPLSSALAANVPNCTQYHTIERGETLAKIAARYNTTWRVLADINNIKDPNRIFYGTRICVSVSAATTPTTPPATPRPTTTPAPVPSFSIVSVNPDQSVTIRTANFPANLTFNVLWGNMGTRGENGLHSGSLTSGSGGTFTATVNIPSQMHGKDRIAIRLESTTTRHFSYNWFYNRATATTTPGSGETGRVPTFSITSVNRDQTVTIRTANFPANRTFNVTMGAMGTKGVGGVNVATIDSGSGGAFTSTFNIPASLAGSSRIAIRLESTTSGHFSYNWFYNTSTP